MDSSFSLIFRQLLKGYYSLEKVFQAIHSINIFYHRDL